MNDHHQDESPIQAVVSAPPPMPAGRTISDDRMNVATSPDKELASRLQNRVVVLLMLFIATGALGIPLLWINKKFSTAERIFWTIAVSLYTVGVLLLGGIIIVWMWNRTMGAIYQ